MENAWLILALLVIPAGYVVFELHAFNDKLKWCEHNLSKLKSQVSAEEKKNEHFLNTISKLEKQIEDLRTESKSHMDREKSKSEDLQKELLRLDLQMKDSARDLISTINEEKKKTFSFIIYFTVKVRIIKHCCAVLIKCLIKTCFIIVFQNKELSVMNIVAVI